MKKQFTATVWQEEEWFVARCNEFEIASQGRSTDDALLNLKEAIELHFDQPVASVFPRAYKLEAEIN